MLRSGSKYKSPNKENTPSLDAVSSCRSTPKRKTLVLSKPKEVPQIKAKETVYTVDESSEFFGKRKRKTEKQLSILQNELRGSNLLWSREKIAEIAE